MPHALHQYGPGSQDFRFRSTQRHSVPKMTATLLLQIKINHVRRTTHATNKHRMKKLGDPLVENLLENLFETDHLHSERAVAECSKRRAKLEFYTCPFACLMTILRL